LECRVEYLRFARLPWGGQSVVTRLASRG
jgi:hypothetical protein